MVITHVWLLLLAREKLLASVTGFNCTFDVCVNARPEYRLSCTTSGGFNPSVAVVEASQSAFTERCRDDDLGTVQH